MTQGLYFAYVRHGLTNWGEQQIGPSCERPDLLFEGFTAIDTAATSIIGAVGNRRVSFTHSPKWRCADTCTRLESATAQHHHVVDSGFAAGDERFDGLRILCSDQRIVQPREWPRHGQLFEAALEHGKSMVAPGEEPMTSWARGESVDHVETYADMTCRTNRAFAEWLRASFELQQSQHADAGLMAVLVGHKETGDPILKRATGGRCCMQHSNGLEFAEPMLGQFDGTTISVQLPWRPEVVVQTFELNELHGVAL